MWVGGRRPWPAEVGEVVWAARGAGVAVMRAALAAGVSEAAAWRWIQERGGVRPRRPVPPSGRFLSLAEREEIAAGAAGGLGVRQIARQLGRAPSAVSRELARNRVSVGYRAWAADRMAQLRRARPRPAKLVACPVLRDQVAAWLGENWSPQQICASLKAQFPGQPEMRVPHETICQALYVQGRGALRRDLAACLRTGRAIRRPKRRADERRGQIPGMIMISERPAETEDRAVPGHLRKAT
jgi:IS30 family transposase